MKMNRAVGLTVLLSAMVLVFAAAPAVAGEQSWESERAKKLFDTAMDLVNRGKHELACPMLEESLSLEQGMGTKYYLARCYEQIGRLAAAHALLLEVAQEAAGAGRTKRARHARQAADELAPKVPRLTVIVPAELAESTSLVVTTDGKALPREAWGKTMLMNLGEHEVVVRQSGSRLAWRTRVWMAKEREAKTVRVPLLDSLRELDQDHRNDGEVPMPAVPPPSGDGAEDASIDGMLVAGVASAVAAVGFVVVFNVAWAEMGSIKSDAGFDRYRESLFEGDDACESAAEGVEFPNDLGAMSAAEVVDVCDTAASYETVQFVSLAASAVLSGLAIGLIVGSDTVSGEDEPLRPQVAVHLGDRFSGLALQGRF